MTSRTALLRSSSPVSSPFFNRFLRYFLLASAAGIFALLASCSALQSQNPGGNLKPVNAHVVGGADAVMLKGHDVVAYFTLGKHALGSAQFASQYKGVTFHFSSAEHKALFDKSPVQYIPQYGGYCANGVVYGIPWGGDANMWRIDNGKLYIFGGQMSKEGFELALAENTLLADRYWKEEITGNNSFLQRAKRLIFRVPHYKNSEDLAREIAAKKAKG